MAFTISRSESALTEREKENVEKDCARTAEGVISSQLQLKSSMSSHESMDKHAVLRRIRQRRFNNRAKHALESLIGNNNNSEANNTNNNNNTATCHEQKWLQLGDSFSSP